MADFCSSGMTESCVYTALFFIHFSYCNSVFYSRVSFYGHLFSSVNLLHSNYITRNNVNLVQEINSIFAIYPFTKILYCSYQ